MRQFRHGTSNCRYIEKSDSQSQKNPEAKGLFSLPKPTSYMKHRPHVRSGLVAMYIVGRANTVVTVRSPNDTLGTADLWGTLVDVCR